MTGPGPITGSGAPASHVMPSARRRCEHDDFNTSNFRAMASEIHNADVAYFADFALNFYRPGTPLFEWCASSAAERILPEFDGVMRINVDSRDLRVDAAALDFFMLSFEAAAVVVEFTDQDPEVDGVGRYSIVQMANLETIEFEVLFLRSGSLISRIKVTLPYFDPRTKSGRKKIALVAVVAASIMSLAGIGVVLTVVGALAAINELIPQGATNIQPLRPQSVDLTPLDGQAMSVGVGASSGEESTQ